MLVLFLPGVRGQDTPRRVATGGGR